MDEGYAGAYDGTDHSAGAAVDSFSGPEPDQVTPWKAGKGAKKR